MELDGPVNCASFKVLSAAGGKVNDRESVVVTAVAPPPDTVTESTRGDVALIATFTVTVIVW